MSISHAGGSTCRSRTSTASASTGALSKRAGVRRACSELVRFEVDRTRGLFARGLPLADRVNRRVAREVRMFASGGLTILERLEQGGYSPVERRPRLTARDKLRLLRLGLVA